MKNAFSATFKEQNKLKYSPMQKYLNGTGVEMSAVQLYKLYTVSNIL